MQFFSQNFVHSSCLCVHTVCFIHKPSQDEETQTEKTPHMLFSWLPAHFSLRSEYSLRHPVLKYRQTILCPSANFITHGSTLTLAEKIFLTFDKYHLDENHIFYKSKASY